MRKLYDDRFEVVSKEGSDIRSAGKRIVLRDKETGVNYLVWISGYAGGITPLLDAEGKPIVTAGGSAAMNEYNKP